MNRSPKGTFGPEKALYGGAVLLPVTTANLRRPATYRHLARAGYSARMAAEASDSRTLWSDILGQVRLSHPLLGRAWFSDLQLTDVDRGVMQIQARNGAQARYLERHCRVAFTEAAQAATGRLVSVTFSAAEDDTDGYLTGNLPFETGDEELHLNPYYTFEHFVTGPCNRLAHAAAVAVAEEPGRAYNPFFAYGSTGLGKTHLMQAIAHEILRDNPEANIAFVSSEHFTNKLIDSIQKKATMKFRAKYRKVDVLLIDEPSIGLEPRAIDMVFDTLHGLRESHGKTLILVEQNARKGLEFADIGYVLVAGRLAKAAKGRELLDDPKTGRLFLGG